MSLFYRNPLQNMNINKAIIFLVFGACPSFVRKTSKLLDEIFLTLCSCLLSLLPVVLLSCYIMFRSFKASIYIVPSIWKGLILSSINNCFQHLLLSISSRSLYGSYPRLLDTINICSQHSSMIALYWWLFLEFMFVPTIKNNYS